MNFNSKILYLIIFFIILVVIFFVLASPKISKEQAITLLKNKYPEFKNYPNDNLPPTRIDTLEEDNGVYVSFIQLGSGRPLISAKCYFVSNANDIKFIGEYIPEKIVAENFDIKTC